MWKSLALVLTGLVIGGAIGWALGQRPASTVWKSGTVHVSPQHLLASIVTSDWTYGMGDSVPWFSQASSVNQVGWPACLHDGSVVRFLTTPAPVQATGQRPVLAVDCR